MSITMSKINFNCAVFDPGDAIDKSTELVDYSNELLQKNPLLFLGKNGWIFEYL